MPFILGPLLLAPPNINPALLDTGGRFQNAKVAWARARRLFDEKGGGRLQYKKVLGFGSFGMVQLWNITDSNGNFVRQIAVKFPVSTTDAFTIEGTKNEIEWMGVILRNCEHVTQLATIGQDTGLEQEKLYNNIGADYPIIVMEVLPNGTLFDLISNINHARNFRRRNPTLTNMHKIGYVPNRVLWRMFLCLARAIIGLAYPPTEAAKNQASAYRETINPQGHVPPRPSRAIHFDLDPANVLIGELDLTGEDGEHSRSPLLSLTDFGLTRLWNEGLPDDTNAHLLVRGKLRWMAPEQRNVQKYLHSYIGYPLNVWSIGLIMFDLLTLHHPKDTASWKPQNREFKRYSSDPAVPPMLTWGWMLLTSSETPLEPFVQSYDIDLRLLIARCMAENPLDRPDLDQLLGEIQRGSGNAERNEPNRRDPRADSDNAAKGLTAWDVVQAVETDEVIQKFYNDHLRDAPNNADPYATLWGLW
ncbi:kinase-like protein [Hypoxylon sp. EC38]|nr:kinase-like protein [Hypoxylon sp. EC38]